MMKTYATITFILLSFILAGFMNASADETNPVRTSSGRISNVNTEAQMVEVEVPLGQGKLLTVGGPVVDDAKLQKNGKSAELGDFKAGEWVEVTWEKTEETLLIKELDSK